MSAAIPDSAPGTVETTPWRRRVSTVPGALSGIAALMPTAPAYNGMVAALTSASGVGAALAGLCDLGGARFLATVLAVARRRTTSGEGTADSIPPARVAADRGVSIRRTMQVPSSAAHAADRRSRGRGSVLLSSFTILTTPPDA